MKKYLLIGLIMFILLLASCNLAHKHKKSQWYYNDIEHWRVYECEEDNQEVFDLGKHIDENNDNLCDICNYYLSKEIENNNLEDIIINLYKEKNDLKDEVKLDKIYMQLTKDDKLVVPFLIDMFADSALWGEKVGEISFHYRDSRRIEVYYDNEIYTLQQAFENGLLTYENLIAIAKIQNENCKLGHSWDKGYFDYKVSTGEKYFVQTCLVCCETKSELVEDVVDDLIVTDVNFHYVETGYYDIETSYNLIYSKNDLTRYYENNKDKYNLENNIYATRFLEVCDTYTTDFFEDNVLILIPTTVGNTKDELFVLSYEVEGENFIINIETMWPESEVDGADVIVGCHLFVEVKEEHLEKAQYIKIIKDGIWVNEPPQERELSKWYIFLDEVNVEDIKEVQWIDYRGSIAPGALQDTKFSNNATDISNIFNYFKNLKLELTEPDQIEQMKPGYAPKYYAFVTEDEIYYLYLHSYMNKNSAIYTVDFDVPEMEHAIDANNILDHFSNHKVYFTTKFEPWILVDELTYLGDLMIKEYDNGNEYYMSDELYIDFDGVKIRIIDEKHFVYNYKYYEIIGNVDFSNIYLKMAPISARKDRYTVTIYYSSLENFDSIKVAVYMHGQTLTNLDIRSILNDERPDAYRTWYLYLDEECKIFYEETEVNEDITIYATLTEPENEDEFYNLTITGNKEYVIEDISGKYRKDSLIMISTQTLIDADIKVYVNGVEVEKDKTSNNEGTELFMFTMPSEDVVVEIKVVTIEYLKLGYLDDYLWAKELDKDDIIKVRYESGAIGVAPGNLVDIFYSTDSKDISNLYDSIILGIYVKTDIEYALIDGGGYRKYDFITSDKTYSVYLSNGFITSQQNHPTADVTELKYYKFLGEHYTFTNPSLECNSFLVYNDIYQVYDLLDDRLIGEYEGLDEFEFILHEFDTLHDEMLVDWVMTPYYIETQFGRVYIHTKDIFYLKEGDTFIYFKVVGNKDFSFLFNN